MNIERWGNGPRVFLGIHGWAGNHRTFRPLADVLPDDVSFYSVDLPGYGASPAPATWDVFEVGRAIADDAKRLCSQGLTLVGYCGGANLALLAVREVPALVRRLVLIDPFAYMPLYFRVFTWGAFGRRAYRCTFAGALGRKLTNAALSGQRAKNGDLTKSFERVNHDLTLEVLRAFTQFPDVRTFSDIRVDVDLIYGSRSFAAVKRGVSLWKSIWTDARVHELSGAGHEPIREATDALRAIVFGGSR